MWLRCGRDSPPPPRQTSVTRNFQDAALYSEGRGIFASGSPFEDASYEGKVVPSNQSNNLYIFPGLALGAKLCQATLVSNHAVLVIHLELCIFKF